MANCILVVDELRHHLDHITTTLEVTKNRFKDGHNYLHFITSMKEMFRVRYGDVLALAHNLSFVHSLERLAKKMRQAFLLLEKVNNAKYFGKFRFSKRLLESRQSLQHELSVIVLFLSQDDSENRLVSSPQTLWIDENFESVNSTEVHSHPHHPSNVISISSLQRRHSVDHSLAESASKLQSIPKYRHPLNIVPSHQTKSMLSRPLLETIAATKVILNKFHNEDIENINDETEKKNIDDIITEEILLGYKYLFGYGKQRLPSAALSAFLRAIKLGGKGISGAAGIVGTIYRDGIGIEPNATLAAEWYHLGGYLTVGEPKNSREPDGECLFNLGRLYMLGLGVPLDLENAYIHLKRAAEIHHHIDAQAALGDLFEKGLLSHGVDHSQANYWFNLAANQGNAHAQNSIGCAYFFGRGMTPNARKAVVWYRRAVSQGYAPAQNNLAICLEEGSGCDQNIDQAKKLYSLAAAQQHANATSNLGYIYLLEDNINEAYRLFCVSATLGSMDALCNIAELYENGRFSIPQGLPDLKSAFSLYREAAAKNYPKACLRLGQLYAKGSSETSEPTWQQSYADALKYFSRAAEQEYPEAQFELGYAAEYGLGRKQDYAEAVKMYTLANTVNAFVRLEYLYSQGLGVKEDIERANYFRLLAQSEITGHHRDHGNREIEGMENVTFTYDPKDFIRSNKH